MSDMALTERHRLKYPEPFKGFYYDAQAIASIAFGRVVGTGQPSTTQERIADAIERALVDAYMSGRFDGARNP